MNNREPVDEIPTSALRPTGYLHLERGEIKPVRTRAATQSLLDDTPANDPSPDGLAASVVGEEFTTPKTWEWQAIACALISVLVILILPIMPWGIPSFVLAFIGVLLATASACLQLRRAQRIRFTESGIETLSPNETLSYAEIMEVFSAESIQHDSRSFDVYLLHANGYILIPKSLLVNSRAIWDFLHSQVLSPRQWDTVPERMMKSARKPICRYGSDQVCIYYSKANTKDCRALLKMIAIAGFYFITLSMVVLANLTKLEFVIDLMTIGVFPGDCLVFALCGSLLALLWKWILDFRSQHDQALIVSPAGIVARSGSTHFSLSWSEVNSNTIGGINVRGGSSKRLTIYVWKGHKRVYLRDAMQWPLCHALAQIRQSSRSPTAGSR